MKTKKQGSAFCQYLSLGMALLALLSFVSFILAACGSDSGTDSGPAQAETVYGLGECEESNEDVIKLVTSEDQYYKCVDGDWKRIESPVKSSTSKASSSSTQRTESSSSLFTLSVDIVQGVMVDSRDDREYLTVTIGEQTWMAENLNFDYQVDGKSYGSDYYDSEYKIFWDNSGEYYDIGYPGRVYDIGAAIDSAAIYSESGKGCGYKARCMTMCDSTGICSLGEKVRGICPEGWHLPSNADWEKLVDVVGGDSIASFVLTSHGSWTFLNEMTDAAKFHADPLFRVMDNTIDEYEAFFWSSTGYFIPGDYDYDGDYDGIEIEEGFFSFVISQMDCLYGRRSIAGLRDVYGSNRFSVRCLKD